MSSYKLEQLKRRLKVPDKQAEPVQQPDNSALGDALQQLIQQEVAKQSQQAPKVPAAERLQNVDRQLTEHANNTVPEHLREFGAKPSSEWPAPSKTTKPPRDLTVQIHRDKASRPIKVSIGNMVFNIQRGADGRVVRMVLASDGVATTVPPAPLNEG